MNERPIFSSLGGPIIYEAPPQKITSHTVAVEILLAVARGEMPVDALQLRALEIVLANPATEPVGNKPITIRETT